MKPLIWVAVNLVGFMILVFMYSNTDKTDRKKILTAEGGPPVKKWQGQRLFRYLLVIIMLYLIFDTGMYLIEGTTFQLSRPLHYIFSILYFITLPFIAFFYFLYCDFKVYNNWNNIGKRLRFYLIPIIVNTAAALSTPFTNMIFYIDQYNYYHRGRFLWVVLLVVYLYVLASYPLLAIKTKTKRALAPKGSDIYLYLFQISPVILAVVQMLFYGPLLLGIGFVVSAYFMYINNIQSSEDRRRIAIRFFNINILQFAVISIIMFAAMLYVLGNITSEISRDYAKFNSTGTANILKIYLNKEIGVLETAVNSKSIIDWFTDEENAEKKREAFDELISTLRVLYNNNLYIVVGASGNEYTLRSGTSFNDFRSHATISRENAQDIWVYDLMNSSHVYNMNIDIDKELHLRRAWLNFKVTNGDAAVGIICTGMDFSGIVEQALAQFDNINTRFIIIDEQGVIQMDSAFLGEDDFLRYGIRKMIYHEIFYPEFLAVIHNYLAGIDGYHLDLSDYIHSDESIVIDLHSTQYRYATITPIGTTNWSIVKLYDSSSLFRETRLLPPFIIFTILFILFLFTTYSTTQRLIFSPLKQLVDSLINIRENSEEYHITPQKIYGIERDDEIGMLSNTIQDLFIKGNHDGLTGIFNRRYMETSLRHIITAMSRSDIMLSVMMVDVDFFKKYNDTYGHSKGDDCLKAVAQALTGCVTRSSDFVARYGGEEFAVILPGTEETGVCLIADKMLQAVQALKIPHEKNSGGIVTISIGATTGSPTRFHSWKTFIKAADEALYMSKKSGRNKSTYLPLGDKTKGESNITQ